MEKNVKTSKMLDKKKVWRGRRIKFMEYSLLKEILLKFAMKSFLFVIFTILVCSFHALVSNYLHAVIVKNVSGIYIVQNTMVRGGGNDRIALYIPLKCI